MPLPLPLTSEHGLQILLPQVIPLLPVCALHDLLLACKATRDAITPDHVARARARRAQHVGSVTLLPLDRTTRFFAHDAALPSARAFAFRLYNEREDALDLAFYRLSFSSLSIILCRDCSSGRIFRGSEATLFSSDRMLALLHAAKHTQSTAPVPSPSTRDDDAAVSQASEDTPDTTDERANRHDESLERNPLRRLDIRFDRATFVVCEQQERTALTFWLQFRTNWQLDPLRWFDCEHVHLCEA